MKVFPTRWILAALACVAFSSQSFAESADSMVKALSRSAPTLKKEVLRRAVDAMQCATARGYTPAKRLAVIDFSLPSSQQRLWVFDLKSKKLLVRELVAHGMDSGELHATRFSNRIGSSQSSLGLFRTQETYIGRNGYSLRLDGLERGFNDNARSRAVVIHAADYVDPSWVRRQGRIGRSQGCPAVRPAALHRVVDNLKGGQFLFSYYPDPKWLRTSQYLNCASKGKGGRVASLKSGNNGG